MNLNVTEGIPEKARKEYAALSNLRGSKLENKHMQDGSLAVLSLNVGKYLEKKKIRHLPNIRMTAILHIPAVDVILLSKAWMSTPTRHWSHLHICFPVALCKLRKERRGLVWRVHLRGRQSYVHVIP